MTTSRLPEITATCRNAHPFQTRAHGGQAVDCPRCRAGGKRVKVWIPKQRPRNARELADRQATEAAESAARPDAELTTRWKQEPAWDGQLRLIPGWAGDHNCSACSGGLSWEPGRTLTYCQPCNRIDLPAAVTAHYSRLAVQSTEVARQATADPIAAQAARVQLRAARQRVADQVRGWIDDLDPDGLKGGTLRVALDYQAELSAWLPEINDAESMQALAAVAEQIKAVADRAEQSGAMAAIVQQREAQERAAQWQHEQAGRIERERQEQERADRAALAEQRRLEASQQKAVTRRPGPAAARLPTQNQALVMVLADVARSQEIRQQRLQACGQCDFKHRLAIQPATRRYQGSSTPGNTVPGAPEIRACGKHYAAAEKWLAAQGWPNQAYFELPEQRDLHHQVPQSWGTYW